jgi:hypothetical protein
MESLTQERAKTNDNSQNRRSLRSIQSTIIRDTDQRIPLEKLASFKCNIGIIKNQVMDWTINNEVEEKEKY